MHQNTQDKTQAAEERSQDTQRFGRSATRRKYTAEEKIHTVLEGFRREVTVNGLCRREGIKPNNFYSWTKEFMGAGKQRLIRDTTRHATRVVATIYANTDVTDTDFTVKLVDVDPNEFAVNLCDGITRGRYRESTSTQSLLGPGIVYEFTVDLWPTSNVFLTGHRIRVDIASSNFPRFDRNPNTGGRCGEDPEIQIAHQSVFHDGLHPSHILLPVIPRT